MIGYNWRAAMAIMKAVITRKPELTIYVLRLQNYPFGKVPFVAAAVILFE